MFIFIKLSAASLKTRKNYRFYFGGLVFTTEPASSFSPYEPNKFNFFIFIYMPNKTRTPVLRVNKILRFGRLNLISRYFNLIIFFCCVILFVDIGVESYY